MDLDVGAVTPSRVLPETAARTRPPHSALTIEATLHRGPWTRATRVVFRAAACIIVTAVAVIGVRASGATAARGNEGVAGTFLTLRSGGAVELLSPQTGSVLRTLVGSEPIDSDGRHLGDADALTATKKTVFIAYNSPRPVIESIPLGGGTLTYVTPGMSPAINSAGTELALYRLTSSGGSPTEAVVVRHLGSGSEQKVYSGSAVVEGLSWSADGTELAMSGEFESSATGSLPGDDSLGVQLLALNQPISATNPRFVGTVYSLNPLAGATSPSAASASIAASKQAPIWTDAQFLGAGHNLAAVVSRPLGSACQATSTTVVSVDPTTGQTTTVASFPFMVPNAVFDHEGGLVAFERPPPASCPRTSTTTTTTSSSSSSGNTSASFSETARAVRIRWVLYKWTNHQAIRLTDDVVAVAVVP
jgi:hypothetical protein